MCSPNAGPRERELYRKWKENNPDTPFPICLKMCKNKDAEMFCSIH